MALTVQINYAKHLQFIANLNIELGAHSGTFFLIFVLSIAIKFTKRKFLIRINKATVVFRRNSLIIYSIGLESYPIR